MGCLKIYAILNGWAAEINVVRCVGDVRNVDSVNNVGNVIKYKMETILSDKNFVGDGTVKSVQSFAAIISPGLADFGHFALFLELSSYEHQKFVLLADTLVLNYLFCIMQLMLCYYKTYNDEYDNSSVELFL